MIKEIKYSYYEAKKINRKWGNNRIYFPYNNENIFYKILATGDADLNGRYYIALPYSIDHNKYEIKRKYNLF